jgi:hypothetical protein
MPLQPNSEEPAPVVLYKDWLCLHCNFPLGRVDQLAGALLLMRHGQLFVRLGQDDSGQVMCPACGHDRRWERCSWVG